MAAVGLPAVLVALSGATTQWLRVASRSATDAVAKANAVNSRLADILQRLTDMESAQRVYLLTGEPGGSSPSVDDAAIQHDLDSLRTLTRTADAQRALIGELPPLVAARLTDLQQVVADGRVARRDALARVAALERGRTTMDSVRNVIAAVRADEDQVIALTSRTIAQRRATLNFAVVTGTTLAVAVALFVNALLTGYLRDRDRSAALLTTQTAELEQHNALLRLQAAQLAAANRDLERATARLQVTAAELARTADEGERARQAAEMANRAKGDFLATMSHELRTPLNAVVGYASLLEDGVRGPMSDEQKADVARIVRAARHLLGLINDLLTFARLDAGQVHIERTPVPVDEMLAAAVAMMEVQARAKGLTLVRARCDSSIRALADHDRALQIVVNLLSNAVKFTASGGRVELRCETGDGHLRVIVADTGRGIAPEHLSRIFEPFVQVERQLSGEGVGLGLAISRDLARSMDGDLTVQSETCQGSVFTLTLPRGSDARRRTLPGPSGIQPPDTLVADAATSTLAS